MSDEQPWWATRYEALSALGPAFAGTVDQQAESQVDLVERVLELSPGASILDIGCGGGRHAILLQERGYAVTGVDLSPAILEIAQRNWSERHPGQDGPRFIQGDMRELGVGSFDGAILMDEAFGVFDDDADHLRTLGAVADSLHQGGRLVIELFNPYFWAHRNRTVHYPPGALIADGDLVRTYRFDALSGRVEDRAVHFGVGGRRELPTQTLRCWTPPEIVTLVTAAGFREVSIHGTNGWDVPRTPTRLDPQHSVFMWVVARL